MSLTTQQRTATQDTGNTHEGGKSRTPTKIEIRLRVENAVIPDDPRINLDEFQTAKLLGVSVHKLRRDRWAGGGIPFVKAGVIRYRREDIDAYIAGKIRKSTSDHGAAQ